MKIERLTLTNFRGIREMDLEFNERLTVLAGVNGAGKSTVLDALAILLSWGVARITDPEEEGKKIRPSDITNGANHSLAGLSVENDGLQYKWSLLRRKPGFEVESQEAVRGEVGFATPIRRRITETNAECSLPLMVLYPVRRVVHDPFPRRPRDAEGTLEAYEGALSGQANFGAFFEWFREQDDIVNENRSGREWFIRNGTMIEQRVEQLIDALARCVEESGDARTGRAHFGGRSRLLRKLASGKPEQFFRFLYEYLEEITDELPDPALRIMIHQLRYMGFWMQQAFDLPPSEDPGLSYVENSFFRVFDHPEFKANSEDWARFWPFIRELVVFSFELNLWWMSREGTWRLQNAVREYLPQPERTSHRDSAQQIFPSAEPEAADWRDAVQRLSWEIRKIVAEEQAHKQSVVNAEGRELTLVSQAIESFVPEFTNLRITRKPTARMLVEKHGETFDIDQLSDGEKCLIAMIGDLARRLAIANPTMENPLEGEGVALIDEIDLHLHPTWQRMVAPRLIETFPNVQFIITTHSPQVLSHVEDKSVFLLRQTDEGIVHVPLSEAYGQSYERLLEDVFGVATRPDEIQVELDDLFDLIQRNHVQEAQEKLQDLRRRIGTDPDLARAGFLLHRKEEIGQ